MRFHSFSVFFIADGVFVYGIMSLTTAINGRFGFDKYSFGGFNFVRAFERSVKNQIYYAQKQKDQR